MTMVVTHSIGFGCSSNATPEHILALLRTVLATSPPGTVLATLDRRASIARIVAETLGLNLLLFPPKVLAAIPNTLTTSQASLIHTGAPSLAEAAALAALGSDARITLPRQTGHLCTCAIAERPYPELS